ncbi:MAG: zinc ABC transporter substrate-binding protein, partial [Verrucomicrobiota bacterium]
MKPWLLILPALLLLSCQPSGSERPLSAGKPVVQVTTYPLHYFTERIAGDAIDLHFLPGETSGDPAYWKPSDDAVAAYQAADLIIMNGAGYEKWMATVSLPRSTRVDTSRQFAVRYISSDGVVHTHGDGKAHSHGEIAYTTWLDPHQAQQQVLVITQALSEILPAADSNFKSNSQALIADLKQLDSHFQSTTAPLKDQRVLVSHDIYQYFSRRYGFETIAVNAAPSDPPSVEFLAELDKAISETSASVMLWEAAPNEAMMQALKQRELTV